MIWYVLIIAFFASVWMIAGTAGVGFPGNLLGVIVAIGGSILFAVIIFNRQTSAKSYGPAPDFSLVLGSRWVRGRGDYHCGVVTRANRSAGLHFAGDIRDCGNSVLWPGSRVSFLAIFLDWTGYVSSPDIRYPAPTKRADGSKIRTSLSLSDYYDSFKWHGCSGHWRRARNRA